MIARRLRDWFENRLPRSDSWQLTQHNLYILPTRAGWGFGVTLLVMLLAAINYQLNLGYALTFLLGGAALVSLHQTHGNLRRLTLRIRTPGPVFAGEAATLELVLDNPGGARHGVGLGLNAQRRDGLAFCDVPAQGSTTARLRYTPTQRGQHHLPTLLVETRFPLGLFRAWTVWRPAAQLLVYPAPESPAPPLPPGRPAGDAELTTRQGSGSELEGVRAYRRGDAMRQVVWKKMARSGELVSRDTSSHVAQALVLDYHAAASGDHDVEARLCRLAAWVLAADRQGLSYALQLPGQALDSASGEAQRRAALQALALWQPGGRPGGCRMTDTSAGPRFRALAWRQWPRDTRDTLFQLAVIGWTVMPHLGHLPGWCGALTAVVLLWRASLALTNGPLPARWKVMSVLFIALGLTFWSEQGLLGREAGVMMLVVLMGLKTLELRARRDAMVVFFLGFFLVLTHCLYSQSLLIALAMGVSTWGLLTALVLANMPVGKPPLWRAAALSARSALLGLPLMVALFMLFPRFGPLWGLPQDSVGRTGLSGSLRLGGVANLANDDAIAFRVRFPNTVPADEQLYFRGPVLTRFDGVEWQQSLQSLTRAPARRAELQLLGTPVDYEMLIEPIRLPLLPVLELTPDLGRDTALASTWAPWLGQDLVWHTDRLVTERLRLTGQAWTRHAHGSSIDVAELDNALRLPADRSPRTVAWATQWRRQLGPVDARTLAAALLAHIRQGNYVYTLQPGAYGREPIDEFWLDGRQGFCEHYATSFVVVMRALGVPARVVTGYQGAEPPDADGFRIVRQSHAHAWAEYWQEGAGWQRADPTAAVAPERVRASRALPTRPGLVDGALRTMSPALAEQLRRTWELMDSRWTQWVMGYSRARQFRLLESLGVVQPDWADLMRALVLLLSAAATAGAVWAWHDRRRQDPWQRAQQRLCTLLQRCGIDARPHHPPRALAAMVRQRHGPAGEGLARQLDALDQQRYGPAGRHLPEHGWWPAVRREAQALKQAAGQATGQAPG